MRAEQPLCAVRAVEHAARCQTHHGDVIVGVLGYVAVRVVTSGHCRYSRQRRDGCHQHRNRGERWAWTDCADYGQNHRRSSLGGWCQIGVRRAGVSVVVLLVVVALGWCVGAGLVGAGWGPVWGVWGQPMTHW